MKSFLTKVQCLECHHQQPFFPGLDRCAQCGGVWLDADYDYAAVSQIWASGLTGRRNSLWRYMELLPVTDPAKIITMGEGRTPLFRASKLQARLKHPAIFIKDERQSPTSSFKDRQAAVATTVMGEAGLTECVLASTGNAAAAYAAYCARADIKLWLFLTSLVPAAKMREAALYGAEVIKVTGTYDQAKNVAADFAKRRNIHFDKGAKAVPGKESMKTLAFEIAEELASYLNESADGPAWRAPDWFIQAVSGGIGPIGALKGFEELYRMGLIDRVPKIGVVQVAGCAPMVHAFADGLPQAKPVVPETRITVLSTGDPGYGYEILYEASQRYGGHMLAVTDDEAFVAMRHLAKTEGLSVEPATAVAFAGLEKMVQEGIITPEEVIVVNCSGHTFPVEKHIMDDEENVLDVRLSTITEATPGAPLDGLGSALERLDEQVTTIVVIDDNPMDSRLIRRLLQAKKPYRVFEANSAPDGLQLIKERMPDLVVSDLTMPDMDGFGLLEQLKKDPNTASIPVIIVSAKDLTGEDKRRLAGQTASIWLKGSFSTQDLVEHVVKTLAELENAPYLAHPQIAVTSLKRGQVLEAQAKMINPGVVSADVKKVVLIEDNPIDARLISRLLQTQHLEIKQVQVGHEAIGAIRSEQPHLIVLDLMIPDMNGFEILQTLKQDQTLDLIPVIVVTAKDLSLSEKQWLRANGVSSMWQKADLDREKLVADVEAQLHEG
ncbi:MAG: pyridoxal-phosphate dependent enzyme [Anaerolineae bacterium]|nr:pyridoxal-phosphate dependent enzyme [Anaerolineae bacterium]